MAGIEPYQIGRYRPEDIDRLLRLYNRLYSPTTPPLSGNSPMTPPYYRGLISPPQRGLDESPYTPTFSPFRPLGLVDARMMRRKNRYRF